jgi:hypothetical protein
MSLSRLLKRALPGSLALSVHINGCCNELHKR